jgi:very-short-patch-repair endonuclease
LALLSDDPPWLQSDRERDFLELVRDAGLPEPSCNVVLEGEPVDFFWPRHRLVVEVDGYGYHRSKRSFEDDRLRDTKLQLAGIRVVRITRDRLKYEPAAVLDDVRRLLGL